jgi:lysophospholipase L1-like esterase
MMTNKQACGLREFDERARQGEALTVAFLGGSLTWGANASDPNRTGYRALLGEKLREKYPVARWRFVDAAIGGTGSQLGVFRVQRDVLAHKPDLVFLDFSLNDGIYEDTAETLSSYEAIVRGIVEQGACPVVPVLLAAREFILHEDISDMKRRTNHLALADRYGLQAADVIKGMRELHQQNKLDLDVVWPPELFDTCHPHDKGYAVYADLVWQAYLQGVAADKTPVLPETWLNQDTYCHTARVKISDLGALPEGWRIGYPETRAGTFDFLSSRWLDNVAIAENCVRRGSEKFELNGVVPGALSVRFRGSTVLLFGESTIFSGSFRVSIDGEVVTEIDAAAFGSRFAPSAYLNAPVASGLDPNVAHTLTITPLLPETEPRQIHLESICVAGPRRAEVSLV